MFYTINLSILFIVSSVLFIVGLFGIILNRKNVLLILISIEVMLLSININFIFFSIFLDDFFGQVFAFFVLTVAAAESAIGLAILVVLFRKKNTINVDDLGSMKG